VGPNAAASPASSTGTARPAATGVSTWPTLRFGLHAIRADPQAIRRLDERLDAFPVEMLRPMWAHVSLRMTDGSSGTTPRPTSSAGSISPRGE
jgi:hypothetical protein